MSDSAGLFKAVEQTPRYKLVAQQLASLILSGKLPPASKMPSDRVLVEQLGVSRATVREATIALEIAGFIEHRFGAGAYVSASPPNFSVLSEMAGPGAFELLEARLLIEGELCLIAVNQITAEQIAHLKDCNERLKLEDAELFWRGAADREFHMTIVRATHNTALSNILEDFWRQRALMPMWSQLHRRIEPFSEHRQRSIVDHERIIAAFEAGDGQMARDAMRKHIIGFGRSLVARWKVLEEDDPGAISAPSAHLAEQIG